MALSFLQTVFIKSATKQSQYVEDEGSEVAFAGRSNAGKSSLINVLCGQRKLCKIGKAPGKTRLINFFDINQESRLVDLPGYGYAAISKETKKTWKAMIENYLTSRQSLKLLIIAMDIRHPMKDSDKMMLSWAIEYNLPVHLVLTKSDKISKMQGNISLQKVAQQLSNDGYQVKITIQSFSALKKVGVHALTDTIAEFLSPK